MSLKLCREWAAKAEEDYQAAISLSRKRTPPLLNSVCFHSQQSAEKYLKAYPSLKKAVFQKTHDLTLLKNLCAKSESGFEFPADLVISLNPYVVEFRYPGERASRRDAKEALAAAKEIREFVRKKLRHA